MKVTREKIENSQAYLTIEMDKAEVEQSLEKSYQRLVQRVSIPGFRKGKAPRNIVERHVGRESLFEDTLKHILPEAYEKALAEEKLQPVAEPHIELVQQEPLVFKATVPLMPTVKLDDYHKLSLTPEPVTVKEEDVDAVIEQLRHQHAAWEPVERPVEFNDMVVIDVDSSIEGKPFINQKGVQYQVIKDSTAPLKGFSEQLVGMNRGDEKEFTLQLPLDFPKAELGGKEASFKVKVGEIKLEKLSELNDDFAKEVDPEFKNLGQLRERLTGQLKVRLEAKAQADFEERILEEVTKTSQVEYPAVLVDLELERMLDQQSRRLQSGGLSIDDYLKAVKKTPEELRTETRPVAEKRVLRSIVLDKIAEEEKIEASHEEIDAEIQLMAASAPSKREVVERMLSDPRAHESVRQMLLTRKTVQRLVDIAKTPRAETQEKEAGK